MMSHLLRAVALIATLLPLAQSPIDLVLLDHDLGSERASQFLPAAHCGRR